MCDQLEGCEREERVWEEGQRELTVKKTMGLDLDGDGSIVHDEFGAVGDGGR
jgi:hypothetical protein